MVKKKFISICAVSLLGLTVVASYRAFAGAAESYISEAGIDTAMLVPGHMEFEQRIQKVANPIFPEGASPWWTTMDFSGMLGHLGQVAIAQWMNKSSHILAKFTADVGTGHLTTDWVESASDESLEGVDALASELDELMAWDDAVDMPSIHEAYTEAGLDYKTAGVDALTEALRDYQTAPDQSNSAIQAHYAKLLYTSQQQAILAMAEAIYIKKVFGVLNKIHSDTESAIDTQYENKKSSLSTLAARRALFNALLIVKYQVARTRTRIRAESLKQYATTIAQSAGIGGSAD